MTLICIGISFSSILAIVFCLNEKERKEWRTINAPRARTVIKLGENK